MPLVHSISHRNYVRDVARVCQKTPGSGDFRPRISPALARRSPGSFTSPGMIALSDRRTAALEHDSESLDGSGTWAAVPAPGGLRSFRGAAPPSGGARTPLFSVLSVQKQADAEDVQGEHGEGDGAPA